LLAGCGGSHVRRTEPRLPKSDAAQLISLAQTVAAESDACTKRNDIGTLSAKARQLVADGSVPLRLRAPLLRGVDDLTAEAPACTPPHPKPHPQPPPKHDEKKHPDHPKDHHGHD
jgi:hypothetical protein